MRTGIQPNIGNRLSSLNALHLGEHLKPGRSLSILVTVVPIGAPPLWRAWFVPPATWRRDRVVESSAIKPLDSLFGEEQI
jgi:hypothetical protein